MKALTGLLLAASLVLGACTHQGHARPEAVTARFSAERAARITAGMEAYTDKGDVAGVVTLVQRDGVIVHSDVLGYKDREARTPMTRDTIFRIYSMTKPITSVAVMMLFEEGKLRLTEPVDRLLPELADAQVLKDPASPLGQTVPAKGPITIRDLLAHTSGLAYTFTAGESLAKALGENGLLGSSSDLGPDEWIKRLGSLPLAYQPGERWHYSLSTDVLGVVVERASGMPFAEFLRTRIFEPLGMKDTAFYVPAEKLDRFATNYARDREQDGKVVVFDHPSKTTYAAPKAFSSGGGGLVSTADDYLRFASMIANHGELDGVRILSRKGVELMTSNTLAPGERAEAPFGARFFAAGRGFGMGVSVLEDVGRSAQMGSKGNNGWGGAAGTWYWVDFEEDLVGVMMIQLMGAGRETPIRADFETLVYQALE